MTATDKTTYVSRMFGRIAGRYDLMNRLMTLGMDRGWRRAAVAELGCRPGDGVLDVGTGTLDFLAMLQQRGYRAVGVDLTSEMMLAGRRKLRPNGAVGDGQGSAALAAADAQCLPFADGSFAAVTNGFLLRNVSDLPAALAEMARVLRPGGRLVCLELTWPQSAVFRRVFSFYFGRFVPLMGGVVGGDREAYTYLPRSVAAFATPDGLARMLSSVGLEAVRYRLLGMGTVALHVATKAPSRGR